jgi:hypothetical protein
MVTVKTASRALVNAMKSLVDVLIWVGIYLLPIGLLFALFALAVRFIWLRLRYHSRPWRAD